MGSKVGIFKKNLLLTLTKIEIQIKLVKIKIQIKGFVRFLKRLLDNAKQGLLVEGQVRSVHQWIDMSKQEVYLEDGKLISRDYF